MEIPPSTSLITALSDFTESRRAEAVEARKSEKSKDDAARTDQFATAGQRVQVSSEADLQAAKDAAFQADEQAIFRREAPTAGSEERNQPLGQIIDISV